MWTATSGASSAGGRAAAQHPARAWRRLLAGARVIGMLGLAAGCAGSPPPRPAPLEREIELNRKATTAFERGQYPAALAGYSEALRLSRAIEHVDGIAANLLDLAAVHRSLGEPEQAAAAVEELLSAATLAFSPSRRSSALYLQALLRADRDDLTGASRSAAAALALCREAACGSAGRIVNLQARIAFLAGDRAAALAAAQEALALNRTAKADEEAANSLRIAADVHAALGELTQAQERYAQALTLDKQLGLAAKISLDLLRLGDVAAGLGRGGEALSFYRRARDASRAAADEPGAAAAAARIDRLGQSR
jgi:tetratricopeptide (TPR) repeat protein